MALLSVIRRWHFRDHLSIREIARRTGLSRNTIRKYLRSDTIEPRFKVPDRPSKLDPFAERLSAWLRREMGRTRKQKRTMKQLHADLVSLGYDGSYNRVAAFARDWRDDYRREQQMSGRGTFVPLSFAPGEAFQFDWSEDEAITTDGLRSYGAAMGALGNGAKQEVGRWANDRVENSHLPFRRRERPMLHFRQIRALQKFASVHANVHNHFSLERHLVDRQTYKERRSAALAEWQSLMN